jgi:4-hydroxybenzoate polyprenyltransferase
MKSLYRTFFFGNYFYGFCAVALGIESVLQQQLGLNEPVYFAILFLGTVIYYTKAYITSGNDQASQNPRVTWYRIYKSAIRRQQAVFMVLLLFLALYLTYKHRIAWQQISGTDLFLISLFPLTAVFYYGIENYKQVRVQLRRIGWLKPFIIGFCWAGVVGIYPAVYQHLLAPQHSPYNIFALWLFVKNTMFIAVLSIMFDIKDYAADSNKQLKTFVVAYGLRHTIYYIIIPLTIIGLSAFLVFAFNQHFSLGRIGLNLIPFLLILPVAFRLQKRQSIFFYLVIIDGLMLLKGICGSLGMLLY